MIECPFCNNISEDNKICSHCGESLEIQCPYCKELVSVNDRVCPCCNSKLRTNSISLLIKFSYLLLFLNAMIPYWFANSINKHPVFWHKMILKNDDFYDLVSSFVGIAVISVIPAIVAFVYDYRKRVSLISIILIILFCICNIYLIFQIN
ncbi:MAG: zinc ribbon domain-containing protein [bacterium]|nr:zinc ribbon domain-containing protein [bacterium]